MPELITILREAIGPDSVLDANEAQKRPASRWISTNSLKCKALVMPRNTAEVSAVLQICNEMGQTVVPHGGITGVSGGERSNEDDVVISLEKMNRIEKLDKVNKLAMVEAGVILHDLQQAARNENLLFPLDLGAKGSCMIGGNIATNAGGLQALRYGVTRQLVLGLEAVLADGTIISSMNKMLKNNAGYDLKQLFIGTEGTLGIVTRAVLKLDDAPSTRNTALVALENFEKAIEFLHLAKKSLGGTLTTFEILWYDYYDFMTSPVAGFKAPLPKDFPFYVLIEALGQDELRDAENFTQTLESALESGLIADGVIADSEKELSNLWGIREKVELFFKFHEAVFMFDISLPISEMDSYVSGLRIALENEFGQVVFHSFGHMADGNLHLHISCGKKDKATRHRVEEIVFTPLQRFGGSITAEHGVGLEKKEWLHLSRTLEEIMLMKTLKKALDPKGILNRGKIF